MIKKYNNNFQDPVLHLIQVLKVLRSLPDGTKNVTLSKKHLHSDHDNLNSLLFGCTVALLFFP